MSISPESPENTSPVTLNPAWVEACQALDYGDTHRFISDIIREVARKHGTSPMMIRSNYRGPKIAAARREVCVRAFNELGRCFNEIGRAINRDHTTVWYHIRRHQALSNTYPTNSFRDPVDACFGCKAA